MTDETEVLFGKLATLGNNEYFESARQITALTETMMHAAAFSNANAAQVLISLARAWNAVWAGVDGAPDRTIAGFAEASVESSFMFLSEQLGTRVQTAEAAQSARDIFMKKASVVP